MHVADHDSDGTGVERRKPTRNSQGCPSINPQTAVSTLSDGTDGGATRGLLVDRLAQTGDMGPSGLLNLRCRTARRSPSGLVQRRSPKVAAVAIVVQQVTTLM